MHAMHICLKDLRLLLRDRRTLVLLLALPLTFITIIGLSTGQLLNHRESNEAIRVAIINESQGELSRKLETHLRSQAGLNPSKAIDLNAAREQLKEGHIVTLIRIGSAFDERADAVELPDLVELDAGRLGGGVEALDVQLESRKKVPITGRIVEQIVLASMVKTIALPVARKNKFVNSWINREQERRKEEGESPKPTTPAEVDTALVEHHNVYQTLVPSYTVMFCFFLVMLMARSFISERELGTLARLRMSPVSRVGLLLGKIAPFLVVSLVQSTLLFLAGKVLFGMYWGESLGALLCVIVCTSLAATGLGLLVAMLARTDTQVSAYANFLVISMAGISGCFMPRDWQPKIIQQLGLATPHAWALIAYDQLLVQDEPQLRLVFECCLILIAFATAFFTVGWWRFRTTDQNA